ncbi:hypothetical protein [Vibrio rotiferianus]|uniref:hypothetical protein n=1 Tax=Vibrio rotiferianus TaxID=190895 RepID=UPI000B5A0532|nr:hypothetical protein [Vibrio rotiferianus]ASI96578.1 hypothetical protein BSZ04_16645 [Vibrio rotiferianus]
MDLSLFFSIVVVIFTVSNLAAMGLELNIRNSLTTLTSIHAISLIFFLGWVVSPILALFLIWLLPLQEGHAAGLLLISLAPTAPFYPIVVAKAKGDMSFAGAFTLLTIIGTVILLPLLAPLLIQGLTINSWSLAQPLILMVLLPMTIGAFIKMLFPNLAKTIYPAIKKVGGLSLLVTLALTLTLYGKEMLGTIGSFAPGAQFLFFIIISLLSYKVHFGLKQQERSCIALGMCTRNIAAVFAAFFGIANPPEGMFVMVVLVVPIAAIVAFLFALLFSKQVHEI